MNASDLQKLRAELASDPASLGYAQHIPHAPGVLAGLLTEQRFSAPRPRRVTARAVLNELGLTGAALLGALKRFAARTDLEGPAEELREATAWAMTFLADLSADGGLDLGVPSTDGIVALHVAGGTLPPEWAAALHSMTLQPASRADVLGLGPVVEADVRAALESAA